MKNFFDIIEKQGTKEISPTPQDLSGHQFCLTGGPGIYAVAWMDENGEARVRTKAGEMRVKYPAIKDAVLMLPEGIILWCGIYDDGIMIVDVLTAEEVLGTEESPIYSERIERANEIVDALEDAGIDITANKVYPEPGSLMANADKFKLKVIAVRDVVYSDRGWCTFYNAEGN